MGRHWVTIRLGAFCIDKWKHRMAWYQNPSMCVSDCALRLHWRDLARPLRKGALRILPPEVRWVESLHPIEPFPTSTAPRDSKIRSSSRMGFGRRRFERIDLQLTDGASILHRRPQPHRGRSGIGPGVVNQQEISALTQSTANSRLHDFRIRFARIRHYIGCA